ncbi:MAG: glycosyltransferase family 39 protein [Armatimonadota bacterium]|nr:glycosyltransferase family 39 protein [Armatimonadota bacterium]
MSLIQRARAILPILVIVAAAAALRLWAIGFGLPYEYRCDEGTIIAVAFKIAKGDPNPHFFGYPTLLIYLHTICYLVYYGISRLLGVMHSPEDMAMMRLVDPTNFYLIGRTITVIAALGTVYVVYLIGRRAWGQRAGLLAAAFLAVAHLHVRDSHYGTTDVPATFLACLAVLFAVRAYQEQSGRLLPFAGILAGLAASVKYPLAISIVPVFAACLLQSKGAAKSSRFLKLVKVGFLAALAFAVTSPFVLIDQHGFLRGFGGQVEHMQVGHGGIDQGPGWLFHLKWTIWRGIGGPFTIAAIVGIILGLARRRRVDLIIFSFPIVFYAIVGSFHTHFARYVLPVVPFAALAAAYLTDWITESLGRAAGARIGLAALLVLALSIMIPSARSAILQDLIRARDDTRTIAAAWIESHIPSNSRIAMTKWGRPDLRLNKAAVQKHSQLGWLDPEGNRRLIRAIPRFRAVYEIITMGYLDQEKVDIYYDVSKVVEKRAEYVVTASYPSIYWDTPDRFDRELIASGNYKLIKTFSPFSTPTPPPLDTDRIDGYYMPYSKYEGVVRPGPLVHVYKATYLSPDRGGNGEGLAVARRRAILRALSRIGVGYFL